MQRVSFPDINKTPTEQTIAPPCKNTPIPGLPTFPGAVDPEDDTLPDAAAPGHLRAHPPTARPRTRTARTKAR